MTALPPINESCLGDIDTALTKHFLTGRGWIGYVLALPEEHAQSLRAIAAHARSKMLRHIGVFLPEGKRVGTIQVNLEGKVIGGGTRNFKCELHVVDLLQRPLVIQETEVPNYIRPADTVSDAVKHDDPTIIEPELLEAAQLGGIDVTGKTKQEILTLLLKV